MKQIEEKIMMLNVSEQPKQEIETKPATTVTVTQLASTPLVNEREKMPLDPDLTPARPKEVTIVLVEQAPLTLTQRALQNYFDKHYSELFLNDISPQERLKSLTDFSKEIKSSIDKVIAVRGKEKQLKVQHAQISRLLEVFETNDSYKYKRQYFYQLTAEHSAAFKLLLDLSSSEEKNALNAIIDAQKANSRNSTILYGASVLFSPVIVMSRLILSQKNQDYWASLAPVTLDAQAKALIKEVAKSVLTNLNSELVKVGAERNEKENAASLDDLQFKQLIKAEASESLLMLAQANTVTQSYEELASALTIRDEPFVSVKAEIQNELQQSYVAQLQGAVDEKVKIDTLVATMRSKVKELEALLVLKSKKEGVLLQINPLESLMNVFNQHSTNRLIGPVANEPLLKLQSKLDELDREINIVAQRLSSNHVQQRDLYTLISINELKELITTNSVAKEFDRLLLSIVTEAPGFSEPLSSEKTAIDYFIERYRAVVTHDSEDEERRLANLGARLTQVESLLGSLLSARNEHDSLALKVAQVRDMHQVLSSHNANPLLLNLVVERLHTLDEQFTAARRKRDSVINQLALGNEDLKQHLIQENSAELLKILEVNKAAKECIEQYKLLKDKINLLSQINLGARVLDSYVYEHTTWWVKLTDFLAKFFSIFKTDASKMIDQAKELKTELIKSKAQCEQEIDAHIYVIKEDSAVGNDLLADLPDQHHYESIKTDLDDLNVDKTMSLLSRVSLFKPKSKPVEMKPDNLTSDELYDSSFSQVHG